MLNEQAGGLTARIAEVEKAVAAQKQGVRESRVAKTFWFTLGLGCRVKLSVVLPL